MVAFLFVARPLRQIRRVMPGAGKNTQLAIYFDDLNNVESSNNYR